jgi:hypothetical protein
MNWEYAGKMSKYQSEELNPDSLAQETAGLTSRLLSHLANLENAEWGMESEVSGISPPSYGHWKYLTFSESLPQLL